MSRNKARLVAMQGLFQLDSGNERLKHVVECRSSEEKLNDRDLAYINNLVQNIINQRAKVDEIISRFSIDWDIHRLGKVERAILRLAIGEMLFLKDVPISVAINEAVRLAKKYGADNASKFINGILGKFSREELGENPVSEEPPEEPPDDVEIEIVEKESDIPGQA